MGVVRCWLVGIALLAASAGAASAADRYVARTGNWDDPLTWGTSCGGGDGAVPAAGDLVRLCPGKTVTIPCGVHAVLGRIVDQSGNWAGLGGGLVADHAACPADQVGSMTFENDDLGTTGVLLDSMQPPAVFVMRGRGIYDSAPIGVMDFTPAEGCATSGSCFEMSWPAPLVEPEGIATLLAPAPGTARLIRMESGQHVHDALVVESTATSPARVRVTPGALDDHFGAASGFTPSLKMARPTSVSAWDTSNPNRIRATIPTGTVAGGYLHDGRCIVMDRSAEQRSGSFYRIAGTVDGGASDDRLVLDPWEQIAAEDAAGGAAWIAPCLKPGDRFSASEPFTLRPAVAGADGVSFLFRATICPVLEDVFLPDSSVARSPIDGGHAATLNFADPPANCRVRGPVVQIGLRNEPGNTPQAVAVWGANGFWFDQFTTQGYYRPIPSLSANVHHAMHVGDSRGVVANRWSVSWSNNECGWVNNLEGIEIPALANDRPFEGVELTVRNSNCHDIVIMPSENHSDGGRGWACGAGVDTPGINDCRYENNLIWSVPNGLVLAGKEDGVSQARARDNVVAYSRPFKQDTTAATQSISLASASSRGWTTAWAVNNALVGSPRRGTGPTYAYNTPGHVAYSWIGEHMTALRWLTAGADDPSVYGVLMDAQGPGATSRAGVSFVRNGMVGTFRIRDLWIRRLCVPGQAVYGVQNTGGSGATAALDWTRMTLGLDCSEFAGAEEGAAGPGSAAVLFGNVAGSDANLNTSVLQDWLIANGDDGAGDPTDPNDEWSTFGVKGAVCTSNCATITDVACTANRVGATASAGCNNTTGNATLVNVRRVGAPGAPVLGARYAGLVRRVKAFDDFGLPETGLSEQQSPSDAPDLSVLPSDLSRALAPATLVAGEASALAFAGTPTATPNWAGGSVAIDADVENDGPDPSAGVRVEYWAFDEEFAGGTAAGYPIAVFAIGTVPGNGSAPVNTAAPLVLPPSGSSCTALVLTEQTPQGRVARDWVTLACGAVGDASLALPTDPDADGWVGSLDLCPALADPLQLDNDGDGLGNLCDPTPNPEPASLLGGLAALAALGALGRVNRGRCARRPYRD